MRVKNTNFVEFYGALVVCLMAWAITIGTLSYRGFLLSLGLHVVILVLIYWQLSLVEKGKREVGALCVTASFVIISACVLSSLAVGCNLFGYAEISWTAFVSVTVVLSIVACVSLLGGIAAVLQADGKRVKK